MDNPKIDIFNYKGYIFDLDDTLYSEKQYLFSAYEEIANNISTSNGLDANQIKMFLIENFIKNGRKNLFDNLINKFNLAQNSMNEILHVLRNHKTTPKIKLYPEMEELIKKLIVNNKSIYILTNGNVVQQKNKINQIDWSEIAGLKFVFANELNPKPSPESAFYIIQDSSIGSRDILFIGDSEVDRECAMQAGIDFMNVNSILFNQSTK